MRFARATTAVLTVGNGRGFVIDGPDHERLVTTAAHCLPYLPPANAASLLQERTYGTFLGPLGETPTVWTECRFVDPVADIAVLGPPDDQALPDEHDAYEELVESAVALSIGDLPEGGPGWLLWPEGEWLPCRVECFGGPFFVKDDAGRRIVGGMSGSPILADDGSAVGVICTGVLGIGGPEGPHPHLSYNLPGWLACEWVRRQRAEAERKRIEAALRRNQR
jgi:hypothetical protein